MLLRFCRTTFLETAVYTKGECGNMSDPWDIPWLPLESVENLLFPPTEQFLLGPVDQCEKKRAHAFSISCDVRAKNRDLQQTRFWKTGGTCFPGQKDFKLWKGPTDKSKVPEPGKFWSANAKTWTESELRKADRKVGVNCYINKSEALDLRLAHSCRCLSRFRLEIF